MRTLCLADVHGAHKALVQVLERANFDPEKDKLISLGDICDGYPEVDKCIDYLIKIPNKVLIRGNHDEWAYDSLKRGECDSCHFTQGGKWTMHCYTEEGELQTSKMLDHMTNFFNKQVYSYEENNMFFVHGGFNPDVPLELQEPHELMWDRDMTARGMRCQKANPDGKVSKFDKIFIGHTPTIMWNNQTYPIITNDVINLDTGAGYGFKLTVMDVDTLEYWQSDFVEDMYPGHNPRG